MKIKNLFGNPEIFYIYNDIFDLAWFNSKYELNLSRTDNNFWNVVSKYLISGLDPNEYFDSDWYYAQNNDVKTSGTDPLIHYIRQGESEGRKPNPFFDPRIYRKENPDLGGYQGNLLSHFIKHGVFENRISSDFDLNFKESSFEFFEDLLYEFTEKNIQKVAVLIPIFNNWCYTERCIRSILKTIDHNIVDIFVLDDCSDDNSVNNLKTYYPLINVIKTESNLGFTRACNFGFKHLGKYKYIYLLNNDTELLDGSILSCLAIVEADLEVGIAGSRLINTDGSLQESGGVIFSDGRGWNWGRDSSPNLSKFSFSRPVDYISGAGILIRNDYLKLCNFFDENYAPAYFEDTDLAFKIRDLGKKVVVASESNLIHHEGKSHGVDTSNSIKRFQTINQSKFVKKWEHVLNSSHYPNKSPYKEIAAFRINSNFKKILWIDSIIPQIHNDSGSIRAHSLLKIALSKNFNIIFLPDDGKCNSLDGSRLRNQGIATCSSLSEVREEFGADFDYVWVSRITNLVKYYSQLRNYFPLAKIIFDTVDLHGLREIREWQGINSNLELQGQKTLKKELEFIKKVDSTLVVSTLERDILFRDYGLSSEIVTNIHSPAKELPTFDSTSGLVFIGSFNHSPNLIAINFFISEIWPKLPESISGSKLTIIGSNPPQELFEIQDQNIEVLGWVKDAESVIRTKRISLAPLTFGAGVKGKIGESLSIGIPVVMTSLAAEGMHMIDRENAMIADTSDQFAQKILELYTDKNLWNFVQQNGLNVIKNHFSPEIVAKQFDGVFNTF